MLTKICIALATAALLSLACSSGAQEGGGGSAGAGAGAAGAGGTAGEGGAAAPDGGSDAGGSAGGQDDDDALIVPQGLEVSLEQGGAGVLDLYALTLRDGPDGLELYAALTNDGDVPACDAALKVTLYDTSGQPLGDFINGLDTKSFYLYTLPDASTTIAACAAPGDVTMTEIDTMASDISVADVGQVVYYYSYFALDAVLIDGLTVTQVNVVTNRRRDERRGNGARRRNEQRRDDVYRHGAQRAGHGGDRPLDQGLSPQPRRASARRRERRRLQPDSSRWDLDLPDEHRGYAGVSYAAFPAASF